VADGTLTGAREIGLFPTGRMLSTEYSVENGRAAFGGTVAAATHLRRNFALQGSVAAVYSRQEFTYYRPPLFVFTPMISLIVQGSTAKDLQPYGLVGVGYEFVRYTKPRCDCDQSRSLGIGNIGGGFRKMIGDRRALRAELSSQIGKGGAAFTGYAGMSLFLGGSQNIAQGNRPIPPDRVRREPPSIPVPEPLSRQPVAQPPVTRQPVTQPPPAATPAAVPSTVGVVMLTIDGTQVDFARATWRNDVEPLLDGLVVDLTSDAGEAIRISVEAHTDNVGASAANTTAGLERARAVREYLVSQGMTPDRIRISSAGKDRPVAPNTTLLGRQQNRRIVIRRDN